MTDLGDHLMTLAASSSPMIGDTVRRYGDRPLWEFLGSISASRAVALQGRDDLWAAVGAEAEAHFGPEIAAEVVAELCADPIVPTSNHFGVETAAESVQSTVLFALRPGRARRARHVVVFGFGSVSMNNWSYPMGLRLYDPWHGRIEGLPQRLPVFPNRVKQCAVCAAGPFDEPMVQHARARLARMARGGEVTAFCARTADEILGEVYSAPSTLALPSYAAQSPAVNGELWRRMFRPPGLGGELVQLQAERICARLLRRDLHDPHSLVHRLLFVTEIRERLIGALDGARACWERAQLQRRADEWVAGMSNRGGTMFFWGLSESGRRVPLTLQEDGPAQLLAGVDDRGRSWRVEFTTDSIVAELDAGRLLPSLFTCLAVLALARGLSCVGGYYQAEYLPAMQAGVVHALSASAEHRDGADLVAQVPTRICLAGLQGLVRESHDGAVIPAGPVELAGMGGVGETELDALVAMPLRDAHLVAFIELFDVLCPGAHLPAGWVRRLALENGWRRRRRTAAMADGTRVAWSGRMQAVT